MKKPNFTSFGNIGVLDTTFNVFLFTITEYEEAEGFTIENELNYYQDQSIEMQGKSEIISLSDVHTMFRMGLREDQIQTIRESEFIVITSNYTI